MCNVKASSCVLDFTFDLAIVTLIFILSDLYFGSYLVWDVNNQ